jgi:hypothetical protein
MFLLYHSEGCNTSEMVFYWCYVNDLHTTHAVVRWVTARAGRRRGGCRFDRRWGGSGAAESGEEGL